MSTSRTDTSSLCHKQHPAGLSATYVLAFLTSLAQHEYAAASSYNITRTALLFLYTSVLQQPLDLIHSPPRAGQRPPLPLALSRAPVQQVLAQLSGVPWLVAALLYGSGQ